MLLASERLVMFAQNTFLLLFLLFGAGLLLFALIASWTGGKILLWRASAATAERKRHAERIAADGTPLPPRGRGVCEACQAVGDRIFHLSNGTRRCESCWLREQAISSRPA